MRREINIGMPLMPEAATSEKELEEQANYPGDGT